ncbi:MAG: alpha/beta fold hydrolase [Sandaracinobacteroides sp.]
MDGANSGLEIDVLGGLALRWDGAQVPLPASRKARALLAFLLLSKRSQHRERLVDLFWDRPNDPRAALRQALSRLRPLVNGDGVERLGADRERVWFHADHVKVDLIALKARVAAGLLPGEVAAVRSALEAPLLAGLDLPEHAGWQAWLTAMRDEVAALAAALQSEAPGQQAAPALPQRIGFATAADGVRIAWASVGEGPPLLKAANWLNHLEHDWASPIWAPLLRELARDHRLVRYDERGNGLSDWDVADLSFDAFVTDLETVADASGLLSFPLLGMSQGVAVAIEYAARHPARVSHLLLWGGYAAGWRIDGDAAVQAERSALITLVGHGWGRDDPSYRQIFSRAFLPGASADELAGFDELQRNTTSPANAARFLETFADIDVRHRLADVRCPTLVMHARGDRRVPLEQGARIAAGIPNAEFITLATDNHLLLGREPASAEFVGAIRGFLA